LDKQQFPLQTLVEIYGLGYLAVPITVGALFSAFSVCLACITTGGRIAYAMAIGKLLPPVFARIEPRHDTPNVAVTIVTGTALVVAVVALACGVAAIDVFNNCGTLSSFGFILVYMLVAIAAMAYTRRLGEMRATDIVIAGGALALLILSTIWFFGTIPAPPQHWFVYYFLAFILAGAVGYYVKKAIG
jgi:amino acid transporter